MSASLSPRPDIAVLPSLPPSPSLLDEVFSHPRPWSVRLEESDVRRSRRSSPVSAGSSHVKGKGKQTLEEDEEGEDDEDASHGVSTGESYPPMTDEAAETRRVEETLKRWELAERQRRKSARESVRYTSGPSLLSSVTRTASLVLSGRSSIGPSVVSPGGARVFKSHDTVDVTREGYGVPLDDIDRTHSSVDVAVHSPSPSVLEHGTSLDAGARSRTSENPFEHPSERTRSPTPTPTSPITSTPTLPPSTPTLLSPFADAHAQAESETRSSGSRTPLVPPPRPLGLPPPPEDVPHATPLQPTPRPVLRPPPREDPEERQEVRWWHEWLCGCGEGPDRGGDHQAGRTNPFE